MPIYVFFILCIHAQAVLSSCSAACVLSADMAFIIAMLLASLNSCCNPWIYMFFAGHLFQDLVQRFLCCSCCCRRRDSSCCCSHQSRHKSHCSTSGMKTTGSQRSLSHTSSTGGPAH